MFRPQFRSPEVQQRFQERLSGPARTGQDRLRKEWKDGFLQGTHAWPSREHIESLEQGYREVYEIDPSIIVAAAEHIESARRFLKEVAGA